jgi:hypothetical protein
MTAAPRHYATAGAQLHGGSRSAKKWHTHRAATPPLRTRSCGSVPARLVDAKMERCKNGGDSSCAAMGEHGRVPRTSPTVSSGRCFQRTWKRTARREVFGPSAAAIVSR